MKNLFIASQFEADFFIGGLKQVSNNCYEGSYRVIITGIGMVNTAISCSQFFADHTPSPEDEFINLGIAGSVSNACDIGKVFEPKYFSVYSPAVIPLSSKEIFEEAYPEIDRGDVHLASSLSPVWGGDNLKKLKADNVDLVDMEGYAFASVCSKQNLPFSVYKAVSDHLIKISHNNFKQSATIALQNLNKVILS